MDRVKLAGLIVVSAGLFLALAVLDYYVMHVQGWNTDLLYHYWIALGVVVFSVAFAVSYTAWQGGANFRVCVAIFATIALLWVAGLLDFFYALFSYLKGEPYGFSIWSAQYKWFVANGLLAEWTWIHQALWSLACVAVIVLVWRWALRPKIF